MLRSQAPLIIPDNRPHASWPQRVRVSRYRDLLNERVSFRELQGAVEFRDLVVKYRVDTPPVLRGLTCSIKAGEKIGIVGRTYVHCHGPRARNLPFCSFDAAALGSRL